MLRRKTYLVAVFLLLGIWELPAQEKVWNDALDRYEYICRRCADWRERLQQGGKVPRDSLSAMTAELSSLKKNLQWTLGEMTPGQRRRFEAIRSWYASGEWPQDSLAQVSPFTGVTAELKDPMPAVFAAACVSAAGKTEAPAANPSVPAKTKPDVGGIAGLTAGVWPDWSAGVLGGVTIGKWGIFVKARSNFKFGKADYLCQSDGTTDDGYIWTGGESRVCRHQVMLDVSYAPIRALAVYAGAGYGVRSLLWQDADGSWAQVRDRSFRGIAVDAGLLIRPFPWKGWDHITLLAGVSWLPLRYVDVETGLAVSF